MDVSDHLGCIGSLSNEVLSSRITPFSVVTQQVGWGPAGPGWLPSSGGQPSVLRVVQGD